MTDREMLELAAKAEERSLGAWWPESNYIRAEKAGYGCPSGHWNPLTDDGDALRLAMKLGLVLDLRYTDPMARKFNRVNYWSDGKRNETWQSIECDVSHDADAATRRAIVRAAAEIAREPATPA